MKLLLKQCRKKEVLSSQLRISPVNVTESADSFKELHFQCSKMFKTCGNVVWRAAKNFLQQRLSTGVFQSDWEKNKKNNITFISKT